LYQHFKRTNSLKPGFEVHLLTFSKPFEAGQSRCLKLTRCFKNLIYWCMTFVNLFQFCNRKASHRRSINSRTNHSIFRWILPLHWLFLDLLCFVWYISFRFVILHFVSFRFVFVSQFSSTPVHTLCIHVDTSMSYKYRQFQQAFFAAVNIYRPPVRVYA
jgi:hypothetical protein